MNKYKKYKKIFAIVLLILITLSISLPLAFAATGDGTLDYKPLEPSVFGGEKSAKTTDLTSFLSYMFKLGLGIATGLAIIMIIWGGIEYMTTESFTGKGNAKGKIQDALVGLGLALISYLILYTINPCLVDFKKCDNKLLNLNTPNQIVLNVIKNV